jgi:hypothetical protein
VKIHQRLPLAALLLGLAAASAPAAEHGKAYTDPAQAGPDFQVQGEYVGQLPSADGGKQKWGVQVIALGDGKFDAVGYRGGLPGAGWDGKEKKKAHGERHGERHGDVTTFKSDDATLTIKGRLMTVATADGKEIGKLEKVHRESPTLGAEPPKSAVVLFDGTSTDKWAQGKMKDGLLLPGAVSKQKFKDAKYHVEFRLPFMPEARGQGRGNSGFYVSGCYEIQMLDSFGLEGKDNECGGIYQASAPKVNMCLPPLSWQTYDVDYTAPKFDADGKKTKNARITVRHNGVVIHDNLELPGATPGGVNGETPEGGPVFLQNHGNPVRYRNIWVVEK